MQKITICSLNVRGLGNKYKRRKIFNWLKKKKFSIYFLQEVHNKKEVENMWSAEWGYRAVFGGLSSASAGVSILLNNNFDFQIVRQFSDQEGRFVLCDIKIDNKILTLLNIYAPNEDKPVLFENIYNNLVSFECEKIILG